MRTHHKVRKLIYLDPARFSEMMNCKGVSNTITQLRFSGFCFSGTSLLGKQGQICFAEFLKIISCFFAQIFLWIGWTCYFVLKPTKGGGVLDEIWHFWPLEIGSVGAKHPHDSDHAECNKESIILTIMVTRKALRDRISTRRA